ncbi:ABC transporter substrate-binding protein [Paraburkholderia sp. BCC1886]|uniref:ABC transporter substrate-binding protein n=1 Tax=Paraburkholderia sp. BCC1886 TaxID=2562670 RepID=UPI0021B2DA83|nr:ABC transporter substrate-binding protein [Paraburkholderia sp. BCC1886]
MSGILNSMYFLTLHYGKPMTNRCFDLLARAAVSSAIALGGIACVVPLAQAADSPALAAVQTDPTLAALVPEVFRQRKTITVAVNPEIAPIKFVDDDGEIAGFAPELLTAAAKVLGLKLNFAQASFDSLIPGLNANRFDVLLSLGDFPSRHGKVTFVDYLNIGQTIVATAKSALTVKSLDDLCGLQIALPRGTAPMQQATDLSARCVAQDKKAITIATYPDTNMTLLSLTNGASQVVWIDSPSASYNIEKFPNRYKALFFYYNSSYGIGFGTDENGKRFAGAVQKALLKLKQSGVYDGLIRKWGLAAKDARPDFPIDDPIH